MPSNSSEIVVYHNITCILLSLLCKYYLKKKKDLLSIRNGFHRFLLGQIRGGPEGEWEVRQPKTSFFLGASKLLFLLSSKYYIDIFLFNSL